MANSDDRIMEAALKLFAAKGFEATGIREIAEAVNLSSAALYHYIGTKDDLLFKIMSDSLQRWIVGIKQGETYNEKELTEFQRKHAWFIAFAPADAPEIAVSVLVENGGGGSAFAAPVARKVIDAYLLPALAAR